MRNQMIEWMTEDILPKIRQTGKPEATLLKFASEKNLSAGQIEGLGHLYNTAKTLCYLEKAANRGATFPIIDVPTLVDDYLEVHKKDAGQLQPSYAGHRDSLTDCFSSLFNAGIAEAAIPVISQVNLQKRATAEQDNTKLLAEFTDQAIFEIKEDIRDGMMKIASGLRTHCSDTSYEQVEADALLALGEGAKPMLDKLATFLTASRWTVKRASGPGPARLVRDQFGFIPQLEKLQDDYVRLETADELRKEASAVLDQMATETRHSHSKQDSPPKSEAPASENGEAGAHTNRKQHNSPAGGGKPPAGKAMMSGSSSPKPSGTYFGKANELEKEHLRPHLARYLEMGQKAFGGGSNSSQRHVDQSMQDTRHLAVLQNLLSTDPVLAEADHDQVVELYNTLRENSPSIAGDSNVARVVLRSMIQHDGVSPFDLKGFLDTEAARQKVDVGQRGMDAHLYSGAPLPGSKGSGK